MSDSSDEDRAAHGKRLRRATRTSSLVRIVPSLVRRATGRALIGTLLGSIPGFLLPFAIVARVRVGHLTDAYAFSLGIAVFASVVFTNVLEANVLPILQRVKSDGRRAYVRRVQVIAGQATAIAAVLNAAIASAAILYVNHEPNWTSQQHEVVLLTTLVFSIFVLAATINAVIGASLNALDSFLMPAATQSIRSITALAAVAFIARDTQGLVVLAGLMAGGELLRTLILAGSLRRAAGVLAPEPPSVGSANDLPLWRVAAPAFLSLLVAAGSPVIDRGVAVSLAPGSVTLMDLGERVFQVPLVMMSSSLVLVAGTHWSHLGTSDIDGLRSHVGETLKRGCIVTGILLAAIAAVLAVVVAVAGGTSTIAGAPVEKLVEVIALLMVGLPAAFVISVGARFLSATRATTLLPALAVCSFTTNLVFDIIGAHFLGLQGIALSSTLYRCVNAALYLVVMRRLLNTRFRGLRHRSV